MVKPELIHWADYNLQITDEGKYLRLRFTADGSFADLPLEAHIYCSPSMEGWGGNNGRTFFIHQHPSVTIIHQGGRRSADVLFGLMAFINPTEGKFFPPQLPQVLQHVQNKWGWTVDDQMMSLLGEIQTIQQKGPLPT